MNVCRMTLLLGLVPVGLRIQLQSDADTWTIFRVRGAVAPDLAQPSKLNCLFKTRIHCLTSREHTQSCCMIIARLQSLANKTPGTKVPHRN
ncbi:hypothetical protein K491DRAFT_436361 [Lophiostoma macrostomum CBS 122681]|uniref:Secreted protein n=1 Tax=Lophiostoma macrostomum CBS 122681 TaxID=1314788 RepID=A0A6A6T8R7_9PLEO|nr:hypothetical protein K491DRAFT_436361 [Lophiostoma macrostomum CBS 122681]